MDFCLKLTFLAGFVTLPTNQHPHSFLKDLPQPLFGNLGGNEFRFKNKIYLVVRKTMYQPEAALYCKRWGGHLAAVPNKETQEFLQFAMAIDFTESTAAAWVAVMGEGIQQLIEEFINDTHNYNSECFANPKNPECLRFTPGPFLDISSEKQTCLYFGNCSNSKWVDIHGNQVTFLPWAENQPSNKSNHSCVTLNVFDCEHRDGCQRSFMHDEQCAFKYRYAAVCEKQGCPSIMYPPDPLTTGMDEHPWEDFLNLQTYCGPKFFRTVVNICAMEYVNIQNLRLASSAASNDSCPASRGHILEANMVAGECGANAKLVSIADFGSLSSTEFHDFLDEFYDASYQNDGSGFFGSFDTYYFLEYYQYAPDYVVESFLQSAPRIMIYNYTIYGEFGFGRIPEANDIITRYQPIIMHSFCYSEIDLSVNFLEKGTGFKPHEAVKQIEIPQVHAYQLFMGLFTDASMTVPLSGDPPAIIVPNPIHVGIAITKKVNHLHAINCWATNSNDSSSNSAISRWDLIINGCPVQGITQVEENAVSSQIRFSFNSFVFTAPPDSLVYIYCQTRVCGKNGCNARSCAKRRKKRTIHHKRKKVMEAFLGPFLLKFDEEKSRKLKIRGKKVFYDTPSGLKLNLCIKNNGGCSHKCDVDEYNEIYCKCPKNKVLQKDKKTCAERDLPDNDDNTNFYLISLIAFLSISFIFLALAFRLCSKPTSKNKAETTI